MENKDELEQLRAQLMAIKKEVNSLKGKLKRSNKKVKKQKVEL